MRVAPLKRFSTWHHLHKHARYIWQSASSDLRFHYAGTGMGIFWNLIHPALEICIYTVVFSVLYPVRMEGVSYAVYLCVGLLPWRAFADAILQGSQSLSQNTVYMKRLAIPSAVFIAKSVLMSTFILLIYLLMLFPITHVFGKPMDWHALFLPLVALLLQGLALGIALILGSLRILIPDTQQLFQALLPLWSWTLPIVYPDSVLPPAVRPWLYFNPPYAFIQSTRTLIVKQELPSLSVWLIMGAWVLVMLLLGDWVHRKLESEVKDAI